MIPREWKKTGVVVALFAFCVSCAPRLIDLYPQFPERKAGLSNVALAADITVMEDIPGKVDKANVPAARDLSAQLLFFMQNEFARKGYPIKKSLFLSSGAVVSGKELFHVVQVPEDQGKSPDDLAAISGPFFVDESLTQGDDLKPAYLSLVAKLSKYQKEKNAPPVFLPEAISLSKKYEADTVFVVITSGFKVPAGKQIGQALASAVLTLGMLAMWQTSAFHFYFFVIDGHTGEVLWADMRFLKGENISEKSLKSMVREVVATLP